MVSVSPPRRNIVLIAIFPSNPTSDTPKPKCVSGGFHVRPSGRANATNVEIILDDGTNKVIFDFDDSISGMKIMGHARIESWIETLKEAARNKRKIGISYDDSITDPYSIDIDGTSPTTLAFSAQKIYDIHNHS